VDTLPKMASLKTELWSKIFVMEKNSIAGKFYVLGPEVDIDNSSDKYTGSV